MYCAAAAKGVKKFRVFGNLQNIEIGSYSVADVYVNITAYHKSDKVTNAGRAYTRPLLSST